LSFKKTLARGCAFSAAFILAALAHHNAYASDPLPGDAVAPPVNINIGLIYNEFENAGTFGEDHGPNVTNDTHIAADITVLRYVHTFNEVDGIETGVQAYIPIVAFLGSQQLGVSNIGPAAPGLPGFGAGRAALSAQSGFAQPNFGAFAWLVNNAATGTYLVAGPWISPPVSSFNKNDLLNPAQNVWTGEIEAGFRTTLFGAPSSTNLAIELWGEAYFFGSNNNAADVGPAVSANRIPPIYGELGVHNPLEAASVTPATFREQSSEEFRVYLPYEFYAKTDAFFAPGFYQSFGGKQTYKLADGTVIDSGNRTNESQLRFVLSSFVTPSTAVMLVGSYDLQDYGGPLYRTVELRLAHFF
jgi:hypothetical protein